MGLGLCVAIVVLAGCDASDPSAEEPPEDPRIRLLSQRSLAGPDTGPSDVWGYVDPATGKEYALVGGIGRQGALFVLDVSEPTTPALVATVDVPAGFDVKVWRHYAYTVTGSGDNGGAPQGRVIDLTDPANPQVVGAFPSSHNLFIDDRGFMYLAFPGLRIYDLNPDPTDPQFVWGTNPREGHDATVVGTRLYDFHGRDGTFIYDVDDPSSPRLLGSITFPAIAYHHSGWPTEDGTHLFLCDELARDSTADVTVWDIRDPSDPVLVAEIVDPDATVHNLFIDGDLAYVSYYAAGFRLYDVSDPTAPRLVDEFDTAPDFARQGFGGAWGAYPFTPSGTIYVSDMQGGLFVFGLE